MNIIICVKQVPEEIRVNKKTGILIREGIKGVINPSDKNALELAIALKVTYGGSITLISMGPRDAENTLLHGLAMGADRAILLCDSAFARADTLATAFVLATAIKRARHLALLPNATVHVRETEGAGSRG